MKVLTTVDHAQNQIINVRIHNNAGAPPSPVAGQIYFDTTLHQFGVYNDNTASWVYLGSGGGTVTSVSVVSANGLAGTVATATTTPAITLSTSVTGVLKGNGTAISAATSGTDYAPATSGSTALKGNGAGGFSAATLNDVGAATADYSINSHKLTNLLDPTNPQDASTKNYVDNAIQGLQVKPTARAATTAALPANTYANGTSGVGATLTATANGALATVDGVSLGSAVSQTITNVTNSGTTVTATVASTTGLAVGQAVAVAGITGFTTNNPNGNFIVNTVPSSTTFTYIVGSAPTGTYTSGGTATAAADLVVVKNEATSANNGLYTVTQVGSASTAYILTRHVDMDDATEFNGALIPVGNNGTTNANSLWLASPAEGNVTVGTTGISFTQLNGATDLIAGTGLSISGNTVSLATPVIVANGGTGATTLTGLVKGNGTSAMTAAVSGTDYAPATSGSSVLKANGSGGFSSAKFTATIGDGSTTAIAVTHSLGTQDVIAQVRDATTNAVVECDITQTSTTVTTFTFAVAPAANAYKVVIIG